MRFFTDFHTGLSTDKITSFIVEDRFSEQWFIVRLTIENFVIFIDEDGGATANTYEGDIIRWLILENFRIMQMFTKDDEPRIQMINP